MQETKSRTRTLTITALMTALVFLGTYFFKIPSPFGGYAHLGDCMIFLAVALLGTGKGAIAGAIGGALADLLGGYAVFALPTAAIKAIMALLMGLFLYRLIKNRVAGYLIGAVVGGAAQVVLYFLVNVVLFGTYGALMSIPMDIGQTVCGIVIGCGLCILFDKTKVIGRLRAYSR